MGLINPRADALVFDTTSDFSFNLYSIVYLAVPTGINPKSSNGVQLEVVTPGIFSVRGYDVGSTHRCFQVRSRRDLTAEDISDLCSESIIFLDDR